jgi:hypothetical protein
MFEMMAIKAAGWQCSGAGAARRGKKRPDPGKGIGPFAG